MDHWGDPWADDADDKSTPKHAVTSPLPTHTPAPVILSGFLDEAPWGTFEDAGAGVWATSPAIAEPKRAATPETRLTRTNSALSFDRPSGHLEWETTKAPEASSVEGDPWDGLGINWDASKEPENVVSETSDSATTAQPDDPPETITTDAPGPVTRDDDLSTRPSTSPSEVSHNEAATESPRTSFEDERTNARNDVGKEAPNTIKEEKEEQENHHKASKQVKAIEVEGHTDAFGDFEDNVEDISRSQSPESPGYEAPESPGLKTESDTISVSKSVSKVLSNSKSYLFNKDLMVQLFPPIKDINVVEEPPNDPIHSTSSRKAWYRLTRKQTMREFNNGNDDDNYIRVTWESSQIRTEVNKVVGRWAHEDRISGRGPGARASFYWDTPNPTENISANIDVRKKASVSLSDHIRPAKQAAQPLSTHVPAAFNWSSPSTVNDPWKQESPNSSSPFTVKHSAIAKVQRQEGRAVSVDLTGGTTSHAVHKRTLTVSDPLTKAVAPSPAPANPTNRGSVDANPWNIVDSLTTTSALQPAASVVAGDDDDWGEMVDSPAVSIAPPVADFSQSSTRNNTLSTPSTTPEKAKSSPGRFQAQEPGTKHASPIVRLKGTVSPTSALFGFDKYVPTDAEEGPIGPGMLKRRERSAESTPERKRDRSTTNPVTEEQAHGSDTQPGARLEGQDNVSITESPAAETAPQRSKDNDFSTVDSSIASPEPPKSTTPPPPEPMSDPPPQSTDPWGDKDFSIFESSLPVAPPQPPPQHDPSDPWSIFDVPAPHPDPEPPAPFTRPPVRSVTPPTIQPLTSATNSAQKRKAEEDETIRSIIAGLPDLSYMLRK